MQNRYVLSSVLNGALWVMGQVHGGICGMGLLKILTMIRVALRVPVLPLNVISRQQLSFPYGSHGNVKTRKSAGHEDSGGSKECQI